jgi:ribokinase
VADRVDLRELNVGVTVVGSANLDLVYRVPVLPAPGQTVLADDREQHLGGKGNNQATAVARAGADVTFVAAVGDDEAGALIRDGIATAGAEKVLLRNGSRPTGTALIMVDASGENSIVVDSGANAELVELTEDERVAIAEAAILLLQLEIPLATVIAAAQHARAGDTLVVLNAAPMCELPAELLASVDLLIINETEAEQLTGHSDPHAAISGLLDTVERVIVTLGAEGVLAATRSDGTITLPGHRVPVLDTTGAGDTFCGALVAELDRQGATGADLDLAAAAAFANRAAALSVQTVGAVPSIPSRSAILEFSG